MRKVAGARIKPEYRSAKYAKVSAYYDRRYHSVADTDLTPAQKREKLTLRNWLNNQVGLRPKHRRTEVVNGLPPDGDQADLARRRFVPRG